MEKLPSPLEWLQRQRRNAAQALQELDHGQRIEFNGLDVSDAWRSRYQNLIERYERMITNYEQHEREARLKGNIRFRE